MVKVWLKGQIIPYDVLIEKVQFAYFSSRQLAVQ